jgi:membrane fusion protein
MATSLFRQEVIEARRDRLAGAVVAATPPRSSLYVWLLVAVAVVVALVLIFGQHGARAQMKGIVSYDSGIARVQSNAPGVVRAIAAREGDQVRAGTPLVTLALAQGSGGLSDQLSELGAQDSALADQQELEIRLAEQEASSLQRQQSNINATIASLERQRGLAAGQVRLAEAESRRASALASEGAGTQRQVEESRAVLLSRRAELESINERIIGQRDALRLATAGVAERRLQAERSRSELAARRAGLARERSGIAREDGLVFTAPVDGLVEHVGVQIGERTGADATLVTIVPGGSRMEIWLYAASREAGFVRPGQDVRLLFDAFPHQTYGAGRGTVRDISRVPVDAASLDRALGLEGPVFRIRVTIDQLPEAASVSGRLRAGMTLSAAIQLERRPLWQLLFNPFASALGR